MAILMLARPLLDYMSLDMMCGVTKHLLAGEPSSLSVVCLIAYSEVMITCAAAKVAHRQRLGPGSACNRGNAVARGSRCRWLLLSKTELFMGGTSAVETGIFVVDLVQSQPRWFQ